MKTYRFKITGVIDANGEEIAEAVIKNRLVSAKGISKINVESLKEIK